MAISEPPQLESSKLQFLIALSVCDLSATNPQICPLSLSEIAKLCQGLPLKFTKVLLFVLGLLGMEEMSRLFEGAVSDAETLELL